MGKFEDKIVLITGATSGIGRATAYEFAKEGAKIILVGTNEERARDVRDKINEEYRNCAEYYLCDISKSDEVDDLKKRISDRYSVIDVLFNNAGVFLTSDLEHMDVECWKKSFQVNVDGTMFMTKAFIDMLKINKGCIINNASVSGLDSFTSGSKNYMYGASKSAQIFKIMCFELCGDY